MRPRGWWWSPGPASAPSRPGRTSASSSSSSRPRATASSASGWTSARPWTSALSPLIAAIRGYAFGGGLELALACDIRLASEDAQLGLTEINLAIIPGGGGTQRLPRLVGRGKALEMILTGARIGAAEALRIGLVERVVAAPEVLGQALDLARTLAAKAPVALRYAKEAVVKGLALPLADGLRLEQDLSTLLRTTEDRVEGAKAFLEKRAPRWTGR
jgi:enoyl-CoA hydratase